MYYAFCFGPSLWPAGENPADLQVWETQRRFRITHPTNNCATITLCSMFARKIHVEVLEPGAPRDCPVAWLDSFCMRNFTGRSAFDDLLPVADGLMEAGFRVDLQFLKHDLEDWLTRKVGSGSQVIVRFTEQGEDSGLKGAG